MKLESRFNHDISSIDPKESIEEYYYLRTKQLLICGFSSTYDLNPLIMDGKQIGVVYQNHAKEWKKYVSLYIFSDYRNSGYYKRYLKENPGTEIITIDDCDIVSFLEYNNIPYVNPGKTHFHSEEYIWISEFYGNKKAKRSNQYYMNHIDEGLFILKKLEYKRDSWFKMYNAFCIHPLFQEDQNIHLAFGDARLYQGLINDHVLILAMEYRNVANAHLPKHPIKKPEEIELGPFPQIKTMLIADKIQNCKDLELYNKNHPNYERLYHYFHHEWFPRLGISEEFYKLCVNDIEGKISST